MNINDYLITSANLEWRRLLADWVPPLPARFNVWLVNRLGEVFVVTDTGEVLRLDAGSGTCEEVARDRVQFAQLLDTGDNADRWFRVGLVDQCRRSGMTLQSHQCYGFRIPPTLGGRYEVANLMPTRLDVHYSYQAYICKQTDIYWVPPF
jgi:hypothetical protein